MAPCSAPSPAAHWVPVHSPGMAGPSRSPWGAGAARRPRSWARPSRQPPARCTRSPRAAQQQHQPLRVPCPAAAPRPGTPAPPVPLAGRPLGQAGGHRERRQHRVPGAPPAPSRGARGRGLPEPRPPAVVNRGATWRPRHRPGDSNSPGAVGSPPHSPIAYVPRTRRPGSDEGRPDRPPQCRPTGRGRCRQQQRPVAAGGGAVFPLLPLPALHEAVAGLRWGSGGAGGGRGWGAAQTRGSEARFPTEGRARGLPREGCESGALRDTGGGDPRPEGSVLSQRWSRCRPAPGRRWELPRRVFAARLGICRPRGGGGGGEVASASCQGLETCECRHQSWRCATTQFRRCS